MIDSNEISLDNVLNTGENENRTVESNEGLTAEEIAAKATADAAAAKDNEDNEEGNAPTDEEVAASQQENVHTLQNLFNTFADEASLSEDNKAIRTQLLDKHKGTAFDAEGNIVDAEGKVLTTSKELIDYSVAEDKVVLDDKGNQVDTEGNVVKTNVEIAVETTVVNKLHSESDYEFLNEDGSVRIYSDDEAGIKEFTNDVSGERFNEWKSEFFNQTPELAEVTKHLLSGKSLDTYNTSVDYSKLDTTDMSKDEKMKYIRRSFEVTGLGEERINGLLQLFTDSNTIDSEVAKALPALQAHEEQESTQRDADYQQSVENRNTQIAQYWQEVESTVTAGKLNDISIPDNDKQGFFDYLSAVVDDKGNSQEMLDSRKETTEQQLQMKYLRFKGYDLSKLVDSKVKTQKVATLKDLIRKSAKIKSTPVNDSRKNVTSGKDNISIDTLLS